MGFCLHKCFKDWMKSMLRPLESASFHVALMALEDLGRKNHKKNAGTGGAPKNKKVRSVNFSKISVTNTGNRDGMVGMLLLFLFKLPFFSAVGINSCQSTLRIHLYVCNSFFQGKFRNRRTNNLKKSKFLP